MTFPLTPASPFVPYTTVITSAFLNAVRVAVNEAIDGTGGGTYTPSDPIIINGDGMDIDPLSGTVPSGKTLLIDGGNLWSNPGSSVLFGSDVGFVGDTVFAGPTNSVNAGTWKYLVDCYQLSGSTLHIGDTSLGVGHLVVDGRSSGAGSDLLFKGNAVGEWQSGTTLRTLSGSTATLGGTNTLSGATTQTGLYTKSGTSGRTALRSTTLSSDSNLSVDPSQWDFIELDTSGFTADRAWTFTAPPGGICCQVIVKFKGGVGSGPHNLTINSGLISYDNAAGGTYSGFNLIVYDPVLSTWRGIGGPFNAVAPAY